MDVFAHGEEGHKYMSHYYYGFGGSSQMDVIEQEMDANRGGMGECTVKIEAEILMTGWSTAYGLWYSAGYRFLSKKSEDEYYRSGDGHRCADDIEDNYGRRHTVHRLECEYGDLYHYYENNHHACPEPPDPEEPEPEEPEPEPPINPKTSPLNCE